MFNRKNKPDVTIHIEGFKDDEGMKTSFGATGTGELISYAFAGCVREWCKTLKADHTEEVAIFGAATIAAGLIKGMGEDAEEVWSMAHELVEAKKGPKIFGMKVGKEAGKKLLELLEDVPEGEPDEEDEELLDLLMKAIREAKEG